ncbi:hypothetical protein MAGR_50500 [Mycolicibacterium agri]|uniref:Uncharacterized protein n=1 Tax=Mycolicibacterium agri TaxID=36811 RepID=A0A7I9W862_MYCAG|nr:hypothetical protein MAGR_50500 [Mycolicibacterium agri]
MNAVSVSWIADADVPNSSAICGKAGRYMSIDNGATAVSRARTPSQLRGIAAELAPMSPVRAGKGNLSLVIDL